jgi:hypothetical protein
MCKLGIFISDLKLSINASNFKDRVRRKHGALGCQEVTWSLHTAVAPLVIKVTERKMLSYTNG